MAGFYTFTICLCSGSRSEFLSLHTDPDPTFIIQIRIRITDLYWYGMFSMIGHYFLFSIFDANDRIRRATPPSGMIASVQD